MKKVMLSFAILFAVNLAAAQSNPMPSDLKGTMKAMGEDLKKNLIQVKDSSLNADSAIVADDFAQLLVNAKKFLPTTVRSLSEPEKTKATEAFLKL